PSFLIVVLLSIAYVNFGGLPWMQSIFYGVGASVIGIIAVSSYKLTKKTIGRESILWIIFIILAAFTAITETENIWLILAGGIGYLFYKSPKLLQKIFLSFLFLPILLQITDMFDSNNKLWKIGLFFLKAGSLIFGSGLAIVPFLYGGVVKEYHWLNEQQFLDAVAVAMITPGPV